MKRATAAPKRKISIATDEANCNYLTPTNKTHLAKMIELGLKEAKVNTISYIFEEDAPGHYKGFCYKPEMTSRGMEMSKYRIAFTVKYTA